MAILLPTTMPYQHACFVSYAHGKFPLMQTFPQQLRDALSSELEPYFGSDAVYVDEDRLRPGYRYNEALAIALCRSACMVVLYTPWYEQSDYCLREYTAMRCLEQRRRDAVQSLVDKGLIIPVILRGKRDRLPGEIAQHMHYADFSRFSTAGRPILHNSSYANRIIEIAEYIYEVRRSLEEAGVEPDPHCTQFRLPAQPDLAPWHGPRPVTPPFPGRVE